MVFKFGLKEYGRNNGVVVRRGSTVCVLAHLSSLKNFDLSCTKSFIILNLCQETSVNKLFKRFFQKDPAPSKRDH